MKAHIVRIGNSKGIRLPKVLFREAQLEGELDPTHKLATPCTSGCQALSIRGLQLRNMLEETN